MRILHLIDSMSLGGAEQLLAGVVEAWSSDSQVLAILHPQNYFSKKTRHIPVVPLPYSGKVSSLPRTIHALRKLIRDERITHIHTHLYWSTIIGRLACPKNLKLFTSYHSLLYHRSNRAQFGQKRLWLDRVTYQKRHHVIFVSRAVQKVVGPAVGIRSHFSILPNYIEDDFFETSLPDFSADGPIRAIAVGNFRPEKNYPTLIKGLAKIPHSDIQLDIYGDGAEKTEIEELIRSTGASHIRLCGQTRNLARILPQYQLFIMASNFEGFGLALAEAMAVGLPSLVSDIPAFREISQGQALFFNPHKIADLTLKIKQFACRRKNLQERGQALRQIAEKYRKEIYLKKLIRIYES